jgi:serine/threonine protein kinase
MSAEVIEDWLKTGRNAMIHQVSLQPIEHTLLAGKPLSSQKGQAEAFFLVDDRGRFWILKKFHNGCSLDLSYLKKVGYVLPANDGFVCGTARQILTRGSLDNRIGYHFNKEFDHWLDGTILMPRVNGQDWAALADDIRDSSVALDSTQRFAICRNLTGLIQQLEDRRCSHRDISCGNVFVNDSTWEVSLIDYDSLYHPSLRMPKGTTCGTNGYTTHLAWDNGRLDAARTWCEYADRYALALLNVEILLLSPGTKLTGEGGMFDQDELKSQSGKGISSVLRQLKAEYSYAAQLLEAAICSNRFSDCPSPQDWSDFCNSLTGVITTPPGLDEFQEFSPKRMAEKIARSVPAAPLWQPPSLDEMPLGKLQIPKTNRIKPKSVDLPSDPWRKK